MTWCNESEDHEGGMQIVTPTFTPQTLKPSQNQILTCPSCGHNLQFQDQGSGIHELPGLPAGVKFDPNDTEILEHLEAKAASDVRKLHPLIDQFIPTLEGENGICYTHPEKLPGVSKDGQIRHFFHRPSKAYTTGTRKRRKVHTEEEGSETRWHKTGKTRPIYVNRTVKGFKKILVLYTNYGRKRKPEKTSWVMHQYHLGIDEEEKEGEIVVSKVFYQTQPRQSGSNNSINNVKDVHYDDEKTFNNGNDDGGGGDRYSNAMMGNKNNGSCGGGGLEYYGSSGYVNYDLHNNVHVVGHGVRETSPQLIPNLVVHGDAAASFFSFSHGSYKQSKT